MAYQVRTPRWLRGLSAKPRARPDKFTLNRRSPLYQGLVFAGLGGMQTKTLKYVDSSGRGNHGTLINMDPATDWVWSPELGRWALELDGSNDYTVNTAWPSVSGPVTLTAWVNTTKSQTNNFIFGQSVAGANSDYCFLMQATNNFGRFVYNDQDVTFKDASAGPAINTGQWVHLAGSYGADYKARLLVNGTLVNTSSAGASFGTFDALTVGRVTRFSSPYYWAGKAADCCVFSGELSTAIISALADPSNVMLEVGGVPLIESKRTYFPVAVAPQTKKLYWPRKSNRRNPILSMEEILYVASNLGRDSDAPHLWRGLVGAWPLQEPGGVTAYDVSGWGRHGTLTNGLTRTIGSYGRALNSASETIPARYVALKSTLLLPNAGATISLWIRGGYNGIVVGDSATQSRIQLYNAQQCLYSCGWDWPEFTVPAGTFALGTAWDHLAIVQKVAVADLYVNGRFVDTKTATNSTLRFSLTAMFAGNPSQWSSWVGSIANATAYGRAITPAEIQQLYADPWAMYRLRKKTAYFFLHTGPRVVDAAFSNDSPFDVSESIGTVMATDAIGAKTWEIVSQTQE